MYMYKIYIKLFSELSVQVKFASCPTLQTAGPKYYKLEAYSDGKGYFEHAGLFDKPISHADAERCATNVRRTNV